MLKPRSIIVIVIIAILIWTMLAPPKPIQRLKMTAAGIIRLPFKIIDDSLDYFEKISRLPYIDSEKIQLRQAIAELQHRLINYEEIQLENKRLRELLGFKKEAGRSSIPASVIGRDPNNWSSVVFIDKGASDGIRNDMAVISGEGLVGRVREAGKSMSKVMLINDIDSKVGAIVQGSRDSGLMIGTPQGGCKLVYLSLDSEIEAGDKVMTSGLGGIYPKGLLIGEVEKTAKERVSLYKSAIIKPAGRLSKLEEVLCIE